MSETPLWAKLVVSGELALLVLGGLAVVALGGAFVGGVVLEMVGVSASVYVDAVVGVSALALFAGVVTIHFAAWEVSE